MGAGDSQLIRLPLSIRLPLVGSFAEHSAAVCVRIDGVAVLTHVLLLVAHHHLLLLLLFFNSLHVLLELLLAADRLPILKVIIHLVIVLALQLLGSAHVGRAAVILIPLIEQAIMRRFLRAGGLLLECILSRVDNGHIFEKLTAATFLLRINTLLRYVDTRLLQRVAWRA